MSDLQDRAESMRRLNALTLREQAASLMMRDMTTHEGATYVPGRGSLAPRVVFLVDHPTSGDARLREPLTGTVGRLFDELLAEIGWSREQVYVTHVVKWRPPNGRATLAQERDASLPWLRREMRTLGNPPIVALGRATISYLLPHKGCDDDLIGNWNFSLSMRVNVLSLRHPSFGIYQLANLTDMVNKFRAVAQYDVPGKGRAYDAAF